MRTFRKCITEFVLDPVHEPAGFQDWLWRYPVRIDIAIEYLGITSEEYRVVFNGAAAPPCAAPEQTDDDTRPAPGQPATSDAAPDQPGTAAEGALSPQVPAASQGTIGLPAFLAETCLSYCEFYELWQSGFVAFRNGADQRDGAFPQCEPCCLDDLWLLFPEEQQEQDVAKLRVFIRLWRKLRDSCCFCYSFAQLRDICYVLQLYTGGALNPDFVRQLAAFQMLRDDFGMDLADPADTDRRRRRSTPTARSCWRCGLGPTAAKWPWAVRQLIDARGAARAAAARLPAAPAGVRQAAGGEPRSAVPAGRVRPGLRHRLLARAADAYAAVRRSAGEDLRVRLQRRRADLPVHRRRRTWTATTRSRCRRRTRRLTLRSGFPTTNRPIRSGGCAGDAGRGGHR